MIEFGWEKSSNLKELVNERVILKDNNTSIKTKKLESHNDADSTDRVELISKKSSKKSGPLSPIDSQNIIKHESGAPTVVKEQTVKIKQEAIESSYVHDNDISADYQLFSENYANDACSNMHEESHYIDRREDEAKENGASNALSS